MSESNQLTKYARRKFLAGGVVAASFGALVPFVKAVSETEAPAEAYLGSASDAIIMLLDLLLSVQSEAYIDAGGKLRTASLLCAETLEALFTEIDLLVSKIKVKKSEQALAAQRMKELVELGRRSTRLIPGSIDAHGRSTTILLASLSVITEQVSQTAQGLLPQGEIVLDEDAKKTLERIIELVRQAREVPTATKDAEREYGTKTLAIRKNIDSLRNDIFAASSFAEANDIKNAETHIISAIGTLESLMGTASSTEEAWAGTKAMIQCLEGARTWVTTIGPKGTPITVDEKGKITLTTEKRKHHSASVIALSSSTGEPPIPTPPQGVGGLLDAICKPNNWSRRGVCYWAAGMAWLRHPQDGNGRLLVLQGALVHLLCDPYNHKDMLLRTLAGV